MRKIKHARHYIIKTQKQKIQYLFSIYTIFYLSFYHNNT